MSREPRAYGHQLVAQYQLPPDTIARYAAMAAGTALDASPRENSMFADRSPWVGPKQRAGVGRNPYTLVLTVRAVARTAGEAYAQWQAGWEVHESPVASRELLMAVPRTGLVAGQELTLTANSGRVSFRGERSVTPMLGLVPMHSAQSRPATQAAHQPRCHRTHRAVGRTRWPRLDHAKPRGAGHRGPASGAHDRPDGAHRAGRGPHAKAARDAVKATPWPGSLGRLSTATPPGGFSPQAGGSTPIGGGVLGGGKLGAGVLGGG